MDSGSFFDYYIAVIIPVYNNAERLQQTLNSLEGQFFKNFFIVIVDDGSESTVRKTCLQHKDSLHIYYIRNEENLGVAQSRQKGLDYVLSTKVPYCMFLDSDDILIPSALQRFYDGVYYTQEDICVGDKTNLYEFAPAQNHSYHRIENTVWITNKVFKTEFIRKNKLRLKDFHFHEDLYFNLMALNCFPNMRYLNITTYLQINHKNSYTELAVDHFSKKCMEYTMLEAIYNAILDSDKLHALTIEYFLSSYRDYQICKFKKLDMSNVDKLLYKIGKKFSLETDVCDEIWMNCLPVLTPFTVTDEKYSDYDELQQYLFFEESFPAWAKRFGILKSFSFPVQSMDFFMDRKYKDYSEVEWHEFNFQ